MVFAMGYDMVWSIYIPPIPNNNQVPKNSSDERAPVVIRTPIWGHLMRTPSFLSRLTGTTRPEPYPERYGVTSAWMLSLVKVLG